jgi:hypothetical protein
MTASAACDAHHVCTSLASGLCDAHARTTLRPLCPRPRPIAAENERGTRSRKESWQGDVVELLWDRVQTRLCGAATTRPQRLRRIAAENEAFRVRRRQRSGIRSRVRSGMRGRLRSGTCRCGTGTSPLAPERTVRSLVAKARCRSRGAADSAASALGLSAGVDYLTWPLEAQGRPRSRLGGEPNAGRLLRAGLLFKTLIVVTQRPHILS